MKTIASKDGSCLAFDEVGNGDPVIVVDGALCYRAFGPSGSLATLLADQFTVLTYDRRGRGDSTEVKPYAVEREIEDLEALIKAAGGSAYVFGMSSGAALALEAAAKLNSIKKLALYEAPFIVDNTASPRPDDLITRMEAFVSADRRGDAVKLFMKIVGTPGFAVLMMQLMPVWKQLKGVAHTLPYDLRCLGDTGAGKPLPAQRWTAVTMPTLVMDGGKSPTYMRNGMKSLSSVLPNAQYKTLPDQTHMLKSEVVTPVLTEFFAN